MPAGARYVVVGGLSFVIDVGTLVLTWHVLGVPLWVATSCGFWTSFSVNFLLSRYWTFQASESSSRAQLVRFGVIVAVNYLVTVLAVTGLHRLGLEVLVARASVLVALTASTFFVHRRWVFVSQ